MYYPLLTSSFLLVVVLLLVRNRAFLCSLLPEGFRSRLPEWLTRSTDQGYTPLPLRGGARDWASQIRNGLTSSLFDIEANVANADARQGLDPVGVMDIQAIMAKYNVGFDQARLIRHQQVLASNNIDPQTGLPLDSKAVTSLGPRPNPPSNLAGPSSRT